MNSGQSLTSDVFPIIPTSSKRMKLNTFCGCCSLKCGTIIIGSLSLIGSIPSVILAAVPIVQIENNSVAHLQVSLLKMLLTGVLIYFLVIGITSGLMIHGAQKSNPEHIFPWLALNTTELTVLTCASFSFIIVGATIFDIVIFLIFLAILIATTGLRFYIWFVVFSFYKQVAVEKYSLACAKCLNEGVSVDQPLNTYHNI